MAKTLLNYNATVVTPITNGVSIPVPRFPAAVQIAATSVFIDPANPAHLPNKVELNATIGFSIDFDSPNILVRILRAGTEIFYAQAEFDKLEADIDDAVISVHMVDANVPAGTQNYQLIVEDRDGQMDARATVVGPIVFSAMAIGG